MGMSLTVWLDYNTTAIKDQDMKWGAWYWRLVALGAQLIFAGTIAYSRMYLGVHSLNQVLYGLSLGLWFAITSEFLLRQRILKLIDEIINSTEKKLLSLFLQSLMLLVAAFVLQIVNFIVVN